MYISVSVKLQLQCTQTTTKAEWAQTCVQLTSIKLTHTEGALGPWVLRAEKVLDLPQGFGFIFPEVRRVIALVDQLQTAMISSGMSSVIRVGLMTASRIILGHWKTSNRLNLKEWRNVMA